jgi:hypothetical protein
MLWPNYSFSQANINLGHLTDILLSEVDLGDYRNTMKAIQGLDQPISELWDEQPPEGRLHVIVEIPAERGPPTSTSRWNFFWPYI